MNRILDILLGIDASRIPEGGRWRLEFLSEPSGGWALLLILCAVAAVGALWWLYRLDAHRLPLAARLGLMAMRIVAAVTVVFMLVEPVLVFTSVERRPSHLLVLLDVSQSMGLRDAWKNNDAAERVAGVVGLETPEQVRGATRLDLAQRVLDGGLLTRLANNNQRIVTVLPFADHLQEPEPAEKAAPPPPADEGDPASAPDTDLTPAPAHRFTATGEATAIAGSVQQALLDFRSRPLAGVLIVSEGQSNAGPPAPKVAALLAESEAPVVSLAMGTPEGPRDARLIDLDADAVVFIHDTNRITAHFDSRGMEGDTGRLILEQRKQGGEWQEFAAQEVDFGPNSRRQSASFDFTEEAPTALEFRARLEDLGPQLIEDNDEAIAQVRVVDPKLKVLFIAGSTFPEVQFLRNTLIRDKRIQVSTWLQTAEREYRQPGNEPIRRLPQTQEELDTYDVVLLYDPNPLAWPGGFGDMLRDFVGRAGGGLVYIAGERYTPGSFDRQGDPAMSFLNILPVVREPGLFRTATQLRLAKEQPWRIDITPEGIRDSVFEFDKDAEKNRRLLDAMPGMYWHFPVTRAKPGATVLVRHGDPRMRNEFGPEVLMATHLVGPGRVFFLGFDSTYRWRYVDEDVFDGFWSRVLDRAGRTKQLGGVYPFRLTTDRTQFRPGQPVTVRAAFNDPEAASGISWLHALVERGDDPPMELRLDPSGEPGVFEATFTPERAGPHLVRVWPGDASLVELTRPGTLQLDVELPNLELANPSMDRTTLQTLAAASGGRVFDLADAAQVPNAFRVGEVETVHATTQEIWDAPVLFALVFGALLAEWLVRKRYRLI